jgi:hypothetical protein
MKCCPVARLSLMVSAEYNAYRLLRVMNPIFSVYGMKRVAYAVLLGGVMLSVMGCPMRCAGKKPVPSTQATGTSANGSPTGKTPEETPQNPNINVENGGFFFPKSGPRAVFVKFETLKYDPTTQLMTMTKCESDMYRDGAVVLHTSAETAVAAADGDRFRLNLSGSVKAVSKPEGDVLTATNLRWTSHEGDMTAQGVCLTGRGFTHRAESATLSSDLKHVTFTQVKTEYNGRR